MKKQPFLAFLAVTCLFVVFTFGFFLGRNQNHESIYLSVLPTQARHIQRPEETVGTEITQPAVTFPVDLNSAGLDELTALPGIGETLANRILNYRELNGNFETPEELLNVEGIGAGKLEAILDYVITGG